MRRVEVAAAVIFRDDGRFLLAQRPRDKVYAGYWEFPGGKIEEGESAGIALRRELHEELGIDVDRAYPWITRDYDYEHAAVRLRFFRVTGWSGVPHGKEQQSVSWQTVCGITVGPLLPANGPVLRALGLPHVYGISNATEVGEANFLRSLERALRQGLRLVQLREKTLALDRLHELAGRVIDLAQKHDAQVLLNNGIGLADEVGAAGVHLTASRLMGLHARPDFSLVGASCHDEAELARAAEIGLDFVVLGPVLPTLSHPGLPGMGWTRFAALIREYPLPVYALGGMRNEHLEVAWQAGAHGIAMMRAAWPR